MDGSLVAFFNGDIIIKKNMVQTIQQSCKWRINGHLRKDEGIARTVSIHYNTNDANILGLTGITMISEYTLANIRVTIGVPPEI